MSVIASTRWAAIVLLLGGGAAVAQPGLPATRPTAGGAGPAANAANGQVVGAAQSVGAEASPTGHRAQVVYARGELQITADDSSLNQILRDIGRQTGMKITGSVSEDRVYGTYGPAQPSEVLESLLEGSGSNMVLRETAQHAPEELILTPRTGGVTPPNPNARNYDDDAASEPVQPAAPVLQQVPPQQPAAGAPAPNTAVGSAPGGTGAGAAAPGTGMSPASPNGVQTPQQIFEQLQRLQQAQQQPTNPQ